jgi:RNA polymerase sigma factor (sigma-70 family)
MTPEVEAKVAELVAQARAEAWKVFQTAPQQLDREELTSLALVGLAQAAARWPEYCQHRGFSTGCGQVPCTDPEACGSRYLAAYCLRRIRGSMMDYLRSQDWLSRAMRGRAKALRDAGMDLEALSEDELGRRTGLSISQVRDTRAALARRPVSMDAEPADLTEPDDVEEQAVVSAVLAALVAGLRSCGSEVITVVALRYYHGWELSDIAPLLGRSLPEVRALHDRGILAGHSAMVAAASEGQV